MNSPKLYKHGIYEEDCDYRAHVGGDRRIYVFGRERAIDAIEKYNPRIVKATQPGCKNPTAKGYIIKPHLIKGCRELKYESWKRWDEYKDSWDTVEKGQWAVDCVIDVLRIGRFPLYVNADPVTDKDTDIAGTDIIIDHKVKIQVKCDYPIVSTGNLFLQISERNPFKKYNQNQISTN